MGGSKLNKLEAKLENLMSLIGNTPVIKLHLPNINLYAKIEYMNLTGSIKDRTAFYALLKTIKSGKINESSTIIESSSGNFASALAQICYYLDLKFIPVVDPNISPLYLKFLQAFCEDIVMVREKDRAGGYLETRINKVQELRSSISDSYWINQYENEFCAEAHWLFTGDEILQQCKNLNYIFIGVSSGGTLNGISRKIKSVKPDVKVIAVDIEGSVIFNSKPAPRFIPGIGSSTSPKLAKNSIYDELIYVSETDVIRGCNALRRDHGLFVGGSSGAVYFVIKNYFNDSSKFSNGENVLFLCPDRGTAYLETVYNNNWVSSKGLCSL